MLVDRASLLACSCLLVLVSGAGAQSTAVIAKGDKGFPSPVSTNDTVVIARGGSAVAFSTSDPHVVQGDANLVNDVFVHDRVGGATAAASVNDLGQFGNGSSIHPAISADGRFVAFASQATNLTPNEIHGYPDIYVRDRQNGTTERATVSLLGVNPMGTSWAPAISDDGRLIAYQSEAANIVVGDTNGEIDMFVFDRQTQTTERVSVATDGTQADAATPTFGLIHAFSSDNRFVVFTSDASNLHPDDANQSLDVFVRDLQDETTELVSRGLNGLAANGSSVRPSISADGRFVAFTSSAMNLVANHGGFANDVFVRDLETGVNEIVDVSSSGELGDSGATSANISADGRFVVFLSDSTNLIAGDVNGEDDVFVRDLVAQTTEIASVATDGAASTDASGTSDISGDGRFVLFTSAGANLVAGSIVTPTAYLRDRALSAPLATYCTAKVSSAGCVPRISSAGFPQVSGYDDFHVIAGSPLPNKFGLFFWGTVQAAIPFAGGTLCIQPPLRRTNIQTTSNPIAGACGGGYAFHFSHAYLAIQALGAGSTIHVQSWNRDPGFAPPNNVSLSDGLTVTFTP